MATIDKKEHDSLSVRSDEEKGSHSPKDTSSDVEFAAFGTSVQFSKQEESALVRKFDLRIMPVVTILYLSNFIDRTNVGNAKVAGLATDLKLVGYQYNIGLSVFYIAYALAEIPSNLVLKSAGGNRWLPVIIVAFGFITFITAWVKNFTGFIVVRVLLGIAEGGTMPGIAYYLSTYYKRHELVLRIGIFVAASSLSGAFGGLLATALLKIPQIKHLPHGQWRAIFLVEGLITIALGIAAFFLLPASPEKTPFLSDRERVIATERLRVETAGLNRTEKTDKKLVWRAFTSVNNWLCGLGFLLCNIPTQGISLFMPTLLHGMGYSPIQSQLRSVPPYVVACTWSVFVAYSSYRTGRRGMWVLISAPIGLAGAAILVGTGHKQTDYAGLFLLAIGVFPLGPLFLTWANNNAAPHTTRAVSSAMVVSIGTMGPIVSSWVYLPMDEPRYIKGNSVLIGSFAGLIISTCCLILYNIHENKARAAGRRDHRLEGADEATIANLGHLHPRFRYTL
ncbi:hypothetical protein FRB94_011696 [Tulasnella sp. JGI-2019a]|nr:hypothetical protein FRB94_011696 [Tulasnella sp. JGI-2019a]